MTISWAGATDQGGRGENEDRWAAKETTKGKGAGAVYAVVSDGMGGQPDGARCAEEVVAAATEYLSKANLRPNRRNLASYLMKLPDYVQRQLEAASRENRLHVDAGATLGAVFVHDAVAWLIAVGDTRCMLLRAGRVVETTVPHNRLALALRDGEQIADARTRDDLGASITRYLSPRRPVGAEPVLVVPVEPDDEVLITSDGVHESLGLPALAQTVLALRPYDVAETSRALVDRATAVSGSAGDNATAVLIRVGGA